MFITLVKDMVSESIPIVLVADSGGVADFIRYGIEFLHEQGARDETDAVFLD